MMKNISMKPYFYFAIVLVTTITIATGNGNCVDLEASSFDSISLQTQVTTIPHAPQFDSLKEITEHGPEGEPEQKLPVKNNVSSGQTQLLQSGNITPPLQENKSSERLEPLLPKKGLENPQSPGIQQSTPWSRGDYLQLLAILLTILSGLYFVYLQVIKAIKWQINREVKQSFDVLPWPIAPEEKKIASNHKNTFYAGNADPDPSVYIGLNLDAERPHIARIIGLIKEKRAKDWFHISIYGDHRQGKTIFMARLAYNLSQHKSLKVFGRRYRVLWCKKGGDTLFRQNLREGKPPDANLLGEYRKYIIPRSFFIFRRKPLIVFIDDIFQSEILESSGIVEQGSLKSFLRELMRLRINIITSSSSEDITIEETDDLFKLKLGRRDAKCILSKLVQESIVSKEFADAFPSSPEGENLYKKQLFAFFSSLLEKSGREAIFKTGFIKNFEERFATLLDQEKLALKMIAICQLVDVHLSESILQKAFPESFSRLQNGLSGLVRREHCSRGTYIYHMGGPFLAKWVLNEKFNIRDSDALESAFSMLFNHILSDKSISTDSQKTIRLILKRLSAEWHYPIFNVSGRPLAKKLFESLKKFLKLHLNELTDVGSLVAWAATVNYLGEEEIARTLYLKAYEQIRIPVEPPTIENMKTPVSIAMGLADMSERSTKELAIPLFQKIIEKFIAAKTEPWAIRKVIHKLTETLDGIGHPEKALETIDNLPSEVPLDALLWQKKGDILESLEHLSEAQDCFKRSIESARAIASRSFRTLLHCLNHYVNFLINHRIFARQSGEDPEGYLEEAKKIYEDKKTEGYETFLNVWAKHKRNEGSITEAKKIYEECISYCRQKKIIHSHSWNNFAHFLIMYGFQFKEKSYEEWLSDAENYCWQTINNTEVDRISKRISYHIIGMLVGLYTYTSKENKQRPDFSESVSILQSAFESPEPERNDDDKKSFQDVITHRALKNVYVSWSDSEGLPPEDRENFIKIADSHFQKAFSGLPRPNLKSPKIKEHVLEMQTSYAFFKWKRQEDFAAANFHYKIAIKKQEELNYWWPEAYTLYEFYANFLFETRREQVLAKIVKLLRKALSILPDGTLQKRAEISHKLGRNLHFILITKLGSLTVEETAQRMDEVIEAFADVLEAMPENEAVAKELAHFFLVPRMGILSDICTKERVGKVKDTLWKAWDACPTNVEALVGLFDISDSLIDRYLCDSNTLNSLSKLISSKAANHEKAATSLCSVCNRRSTSSYRGKLTEMLCVHR